MVYIDEIREYPEWAIKPAARRYGQFWCHMWSDTEEELFAMADKIGLSRKAYQNHHKRPEFHHFDLIPSKHNLAIQNGAIFKSSKEHAQEIAAKIMGRSEECTKPKE